MQSTEESPGRPSIASEKVAPEASQIIRPTKRFERSTNTPKRAASPQTASTPSRKQTAHHSVSPDIRSDEHPPRTPILEKKYRLHSFAAYTGLKSNITKSFTPLDSKIYREICELNEGLNPEQHRELDKMMEKLCIKSGKHRRMNWFGSVNTDSVRDMYVREKSSEKQTQEEVKLVRKDIQCVSQKVQVKEPAKKPFFDYSSDRIREFQRRHEPQNKRWNIAGGNRRKTRKLIVPHPIIALHNQQCDDMFHNYRSGKLNLVDTEILDEYPDEPVEDPGQNSQKIQRLRQLRVLRKEIELISAKRDRKKQQLRTSFVANFS